MAGQLRAREWRDWLSDAVRHPGSTIVSLAGAVVLGFAFSVPFWRERRWYRKLGRKLGIYKGKVLSRTYRHGGLSAGERGPELRVAALRRGNWEDALKDLSDKARSAGYRMASADDDSSRAPRRWYFTAPSGQGLPNLTVTLYVPGEITEDLDTEVPVNGTGLQLRLREYRRKTGVGYRFRLSLCQRPWLVRVSRPAIPSADMRVRRNQRRSGAYWR
jgi:hypothetical protein